MDLDLQLKAEGSAGGSLQIPDEDTGFLEATGVTLIDFVTADRLTRVRAKVRARLALPRSARGIALDGCVWKPPKSGKPGRGAGYLTRDQIRGLDIIPSSDGVLSFEVTPVVAAGHSKYNQPGECPTCVPEEAGLTSEITAEALEIKLSRFGVTSCELFSSEDGAVIKGAAKKSYLFRLSLASDMCCLTRSENEFRNQGAAKRAHLIGLHYRISTRSIADQKYGQFRNLCAATNCDHVALVTERLVQLFPRVLSTQYVNALRSSLQFCPSICSSISGILGSEICLPKLKNDLGSYCRERCRQYAKISKSGSADPATSNATLPGLKRSGLNLKSASSQNSKTLKNHGNLANPEKPANKVAANDLFLNAEAQQGCHLGHTANRWCDIFESLNAVVPPMLPSPTQSSESTCPEVVLDSASVSQTSGSQDIIFLCAPKARRIESYFSPVPCRMSFSKTDISKFVPQTSGCFASSADSNVISKTGLRMTRGGLNLLQSFPQDSFLFHPDNIPLNYSHITKTSGKYKEPVLSPRQQHENGVFEDLFEAP